MDDPKDPRDASGATPRPRRKPAGSRPRPVIDPLLAPEGGTAPPPPRPAPRATPRPPTGSAPSADMRSIDDLLDRGPAVLPVIVPAEPVPATSPPSDSLPTAPMPVTAPPPTLPPTQAMPVAATTQAMPIIEDRAPTSPTGRPRVRRVTRVVRHVDTWSVFKVALVFHFFLYLVCLVAGVLLWQVAQNTGTVDNVERFFESFGWVSFDLKGGEIYHNAWVGGLFLVIGATGVAVLAATLFNLITDLVGGLRVSVLEEEVVVRDDESGPGWKMPDLWGGDGPPWRRSQRG